MIGPLSSCLSILIYHRVVAQPDPLFPDVVSAEEFDLQMAALARWFTVLPLGRAVERLRNGTLPVRAACVTFDDGYADNALSALPILLKHGVKATFFVATRFLDGGRMWNDTVIETVRRAPGDTLDAREFGFGLLDISTLPQRRGSVEKLLERWKYLPPDDRQATVDRFAATGGELPMDLMMTTGQVRQLHASGMEIGAHTVNHPILTNLDPEEARREIGRSRHALEEAIGAPVTLFAYPNGRPGRDYQADHVRIVKESGFDAAVSTAAGVATTSSDCWQLPRFTPWEKTPGRFVMRLLLNTFNRTAARV